MFSRNNNHYNRFGCLKVNYQVKPSIEERLGKINISSSKNINNILFPAITFSDQVIGVGAVIYK